MARHKIKIAAVATSLVAAIGIIAASPATSADAGGGHTTTLRGDWNACC